eukprot:CAMPEP_0206049930 /NCGR_PEP_ID=MMETSP1466-20131121/27944_1 /ASSEMBLY_ACC=CAM_ASM_001126 /TAXON_ID=44452 /ORGANISM="Pavlova gyrans, Strain CCMP608" /LENGTH=53 /DNA_ID=CAMNT_0053425033 /DNA_START=42 /DNA_END=203 /DNA_ORIENTATION=-
MSACSGPPPYLRAAACGDGGGGRQAPPSFEVLCRCPSGRLTGDHTSESLSALS